MRQIKFRVWDEKLSLMGIPKAINFHPDGRLHSIDVYYGPTKGVVPGVLVSRLVIEQYVGLTDENGQEVYEGDILDKHGEVESELWPNCGCCSDVWGWELSTKRDKDGEYRSYYKVIGNIHENPELLERKS